MSAQSPDPRHERRLIRHDLKKRPLRTWVVPLLLILVVIIFLPKIVALLEK